MIFDMKCLIVHLSRGNYFGPRKGAFNPRSTSSFHCFESLRDEDCRHLDQERQGGDSLALLAMYEQNMQLSVWILIARKVRTEPVAWTSGTVVGQWWDSGNVAKVDI